ncbi:EI24 domain-containing protein [Polaribacter sp. BAL334]|uniref:EI24 domain-containing protein n=1 Tax=Polaribacter sp. BAL334 TaxID=1708178 RepID=UPI0018D22839|nr:EI24 domain-containing protein [Polaribacter sp. BAL334]MBG7611090.1 EI24 domain-containing protein [Polaribacter sp. BAL334]
MIKNIILGIKEYGGAFALISKLKLWKYFIIPVFISILTAVLIALEAYILSDNIGAFISKAWIWDWGKETFTRLSNFFGAVIIIILGLIVYKHIILAFSAPFMSIVSEKIEFHLYGDVKHLHRKSSFFEQLIRGIRINIRNLSKELLFSLPLLILKFIPIVNFFSTILLFLLQAYYAGFGNMDYTLERHFNYRDSVHFIQKRRGFAIGNGIVFMLCLLIPVVGIIIVLPLSVTAATTKTLSLLHDKHEIVYER